MDFTVPSDYRMKIKENEKRDKYLDLARELKKAMEHAGDGDTNCNRYTWNGPQRLGKGAGRAENRRTCRNHPTITLLRSARILRRVLVT